MTNATAAESDPPLRVLVADDEAMARRRLLRLLEGMPGVVLVGECEDATEVLECIGQGEVDVVLLDIQMPGLSGLDALALWPEDGPVVVFCTAHSEHAVAAFDVGAVDYLLKPIDAARLRKALDRAKQNDFRRRFAEETARHRAQQSDRPTLPERLALSTREGIVLLAPEDISHIQLDGALTTVFSNRGEYLCDLPLQHLEQRLAPHGFVRVHRRALVNLAQIVRLEPIETGGFVARTASGAAVEVSRMAARDLKRRLGLR